MLDVHRLHVLAVVADQGSFSGAAEALFLTQPAVSRQIAALERETGVQLVERRARGVRLTHAGEVALTVSIGLCEAGPDTTSEDLLRSSGASATRPRIAPRWGGRVAAGRREIPFPA